MRLKPQDIVLALCLTAKSERVWTYADLARDIGLSASEIHAGIKRLQKTRLLGIGGLEAEVKRSVLFDFCVYGLPVWIPGQVGQPTIGFPTAESSTFLSSKMAENEFELVWPSVDGTVRGLTFEPIHSSCVMVAQNFKDVGGLLHLVDGLRRDQTRIRSAAKAELKKRLIGGRI